MKYFCAGWKDLFEIVENTCFGEKQCYKRVDLRMEFLDIFNCFFWYSLESNLHHLKSIPVVLIENII